MKGEKCGSCVWRGSANVPWKCEFAIKTGRTRRAEPPSECTWYRRGRAVEVIVAIYNMLESIEAQRAGRESA